MEEIRKATQTQREGVIRNIHSSIDSIEKGRKMPIGTISNGRKKVAEGKWTPVKEQAKSKSNDNESSTSSSTKVGDNGKNQEHPNVIEQGGELTIDTLNPDSGESMFKQGDSVKHNGKEYVVGNEIDDGVHELLQAGSKK